MTCSCKQYSDYFEPHPDEELYEILKPLSLLDKNIDYELFTCIKCKQLYVVERMSRGPLIVKVNSVNDFSDFKEVVYRKLLFIEYYGGESNRECIQAGCKENSLVDMYFCVEHGNDWDMYL